MVNWEAFRQMLLDETSATNVYFEPPPDTQMSYPCIVFAFTGRKPVYANNSQYIERDVYEVKVIFLDPSSTISKEVSRIPYARFDRPYKADGLYHDVYELYFN